ncbi:MAG TPA: DUF5661 family protein [Anaerolineales bacterium]|jgi:hypothetical protein|nr:DUF5661 family protein [Anaerolineales bacterium]
MKLPEYISKQEVQRICQELGIQDWTKLSEPSISLEEAKIVQEAVGSEALKIPTEEFKKGMQVELEHGIQFPDANVTNNHPILTGMIVLAHLKEMLDYYMRLEVAEIEGDLLKSYLANDPEKPKRKYTLYLHARAKLSEFEQAAIEKHQ